MLTNYDDIDRERERENIIWALMGTLIWALVGPPGLGPNGTPSLGPNGPLWSGL
jgi:hypothetical protein